MMMPFVVLVRPQLSENIGAVARAMGNFKFEELRIVSPIGEVLNDKSIAMSAGNEAVLKNAQIFSSLQEAVKDCVLVYATSSNVRDMVKPITTPQFIEKNTNVSTAIVFGPERTGLTNEEISLCSALISIPVNKDFSSLNLAQSCVIIFYEWFNALHTSKNYLHTGESELCSFEQKDYFLKNLEAFLDAINFWRTPSKKEIMKRNIQSTFMRHMYTKQEIQTLIGIIEDFKRKIM